MSKYMQSPILAAIQGGKADVARIDGTDRAEIDDYKRRLRNQEIARREVAAELAAAVAPDLSPFGATLLDDLAESPADPVWAVRSLATEGSIVTLPSSRKTGKSTLLANLAMAGVDELPFLGAFETALDGQVAVVNAEMGKADSVAPYRNLGIRNPDRIRMLHCRDNGLRLNLLDDATAEAFVAWLHKADARWLFLDPWKNLLAWSGTGLNDNDSANQLITRVQEIHASAGLTLTLIPMHTTQTAQEAGYERAKGAGEVEDAADALWRYVRAKGGRNSPRVLAVEGRGGAGLDETVVNFDPATGRLSLGQGDRKAVEGNQISMAIQVWVKGNPDSSTRAILDAMAAVGHPQHAVKTALGQLRASGLLVTSDGPRNALLHRVSA